MDRYIIGVRYWAAGGCDVVTIRTLVWDGGRQVADFITYETI